MKSLICQIVLPVSVMAVCLGADVLAEEASDKSAVHAIRDEITLPSFESPSVVSGTRSLEADAQAPKTSDDDLKKRLAELAEAEKTLEAKLAGGKSAQASSPKEVKKVEKVEEIKAAEKAPVDAIESVRAKLSVPKKEEAKPAAPPKVSSVVSEVASLEQSKVKLQKDLAASHANARKLAGELDEMRSRLMIAETEVERLSALLEEKNATHLRSLNIPTKRRQNSVGLEPMGPPAESVVQEKMTSDMPVATVIAEKAHLRTAPGEENSPLMTVSQGTRLAVETRQGSWLRVLTPTGSRAWISSSVVTFGRGKAPPKMSNGFTSEGNNAESEAEDRAFKSLQGGLN